MNHQNEPIPTDPQLSHSLFIGMQVAPETELACTPCRCHDFARSFWVAPKPTDNQIYGLLVEVRQHNKQFGQNARRRNLTPEQRTAALIANLLRKQLKHRK